MCVCVCVCVINDGSVVQLQCSQTFLVRGVTLLLTPAVLYGLYSTAVVLKLFQASTPLANRWIPSVPFFPPHTQANTKIHLSALSTTTLDYANQVAGKGGAPAHLSRFSESPRIS